MRHPAEAEREGERDDRHHEAGQKILARVATHHRQIDPAGQQLGQNSMHGSHQVGDVPAGQLIDDRRALPRRGDDPAAAQHRQLLGEAGGSTSIAASRSEPAWSSARGRGKPFLTTLDLSCIAPEPSIL